MPHIPGSIREKSHFFGQNFVYSGLHSLHRLAPRCRAVEYSRDPDGMDLEVPTVITPEFVEERWGYGPGFSTRPTVFYPDVSLWSRDLLIDTK